MGCTIKNNGDVFSIHVLPHFLHFFIVNDINQRGKIRTVGQRKPVFFKNFTELIRVRNGNSRFQWGTNNFVPVNAMRSA